MIEGAQIYGLGSWADISDHIGGFRDKDEVRDHYLRPTSTHPIFRFQNDAVLKTRTWPTRSLERSSSPERSAA